MKTLELVFFDAGGGHRSAANALCEVARQQERPWNMRMMNLQELLDEMDVFRKITGIRMQDLYNLMLRRGWTLGSRHMMKAMHWVIRRYHPVEVGLLEDYWKSHPCDLVVSVVPNFNRAIYQSLGGSRPMVTILTDLADVPPHFWIEENQKQYFICGTERAFKQAMELGHPQDRVFRTSGMILNPRFYSVEPVDRAHNLEILGLDPKVPTILLMFGGEGSLRMIDIAEAINRSDLEVQIIAIAGNNTKLEAKLRRMPARVPMHVEGFTKDMPRFMQLSDVFIGKPGPGSISEAVAMGLPVIIEQSVWTLEQERYNADWVEEMGVGVKVQNFRTQVVGAIRQMLEPAAREKVLANVAAQRNRAIFEIPEILEQILSRA